MPHARKPQYVTAFGYLSEDGILDELAAWMAAYDRKPELLTRRETMLAIFYMMKDNQSSTYIAQRMGFSVENTTKLMLKVRNSCGQTLPRNA